MYLREVFYTFKRYAGHSKWQNIRHTKALKDGQKSIMYTQLCKKIKVAIQENGNNINPALNIQLAQAIENAKRKDMPIATIQSCIKSAQMDKDAAKTCRFSVKGPRGSILLVTLLTHHQKKAKNDISTVLNKVGGIMSDISLEKSFEKKGIVVAFPPKGLDNIEEVSVDHAIEAEAEEVSALDEDNKLTFSCDASRLHIVKTKLEEMKYTIDDSKITFIPKIKVSLGDDEMELLSKIADKIEEIPEVVEIHDNVE